MSVVVNVTTQQSPVAVDVTTSSASPVTVDATLVSSPVSISVSMAAAASMTINVTLQSTPVSVEFQEARDAYQLALAEGFIGTRAEWLASLKGEDGDPGDDGPPGTPAQIVVLSLAAYLALSPAEQMNGTWYVIPK